MIATIAPQYRLTRSILKLQVPLLAPYRLLLRGLRQLGCLPPMPVKGCGRVPGVIEIGWRSKSIAAFRAYRPPRRMSGAQRFVFDPKQEILVVGSARSQDLAPGSPHEQLAQVIGAYDIQGGRPCYLHAAGGMLSRNNEGVLITNEKSPHLGHNWTPQVREQFIAFIRTLTRMSHVHHPGS